MSRYPKLDSNIVGYQKIGYFLEYSRNDSTFRVSESESWNPEALRIVGFGLDNWISTS